ncbi:MAG: hypothetical protein HKN04_03615 [Rhodothermaceae bacterium]|nr:hypothetical protein [Rhodothermaceae bacterium]
MIVVSASMKKAGSGWYFNLTNDLLVRAGHANVRALRERYRLHRALRGGNCQVNASSPYHTARVFLPLILGHTFAVKTHGRPSRSVRALMAMGAMKATYIYRDPRDVVLSILDHGQRLREDGNLANAASGLETVGEAVRYVGDLLDIWEAWRQCPGVLTTRYEDLVADPQRELARLAAFLGLDVGAEALAEVVDRYAPGARSATDRCNLHFNRGLVRRFDGAMSPREHVLCRRHFGPYLARMGYAA